MLKSSFAAPKSRGSGARVLVIGASGQLGRQLVAQLSRRRGPLEVIAASRSDLDPGRRVELERAATVARLIAKVRPDHVILAAAATNVAWCEGHPRESRAINVLGSEVAARAAGAIGATLAFISTDYVFDGIVGPCGEGDETNPINVYGAQKLAAEAAILETDPRNLVVRTCQIFGADPRRTNYVVRVVDALRRGETVDAAGDLFGTPTYALDLAHALVELTLSGASGVWHVAGNEYLSRYELAIRAAAAFGCESGAVVEVTTDRMHDPVNRPRRAGLRNDRLNAAGFDWITPLDAALAALAEQERLT